MHGHQVIEEWMGEEQLTLADLLKPGLRAVCVGINPSPVSVEAGHYYQGTAGQRFFSRLRQVGLLSASFEGFEDDEAFASGVGFTDIVKRPTRGEKDLRPGELAHGRELLLSKLRHHQPKLVIFTFKKTAKALFGPFDGNGFLTGHTLADTAVFVMPGTYEKTVTVDATLAQLRDHLQASAPRSPTLT